MHCSGTEMIFTVYSSVKWVSISSGNGLSPVRRQANTWTHPVLLSIGQLREIQCSSNQSSIIFMQENAFGIVVCQNEGHFVQRQMSYTDKVNLYHKKHKPCAFLLGWSIRHILLYHHIKTFLQDSLAILPYAMIHSLFITPTLPTFQHYTAQ